MVFTIRICYRQKTMIVKALSMLIMILPLCLNGYPFFARVIYLIFFYLDCLDSRQLLSARYCCCYSELSE